MFDPESDGLCSSRRTANRQRASRNFPWVVRSDFASCSCRSNCHFCSRQDHWPTRPPSTSSDHGQRLHRRTAHIHTTAAAPAHSRNHGVAVVAIVLPISTEVVRSRIHTWDQMSSNKSRGWTETNKQEHVDNVRWGNKRATMREHIHEQESEPAASKQGMPGWKTTTYANIPSMPGIISLLGSSLLKPWPNRPQAGRT